MGFAVDDSTPFLDGKTEEELLVVFDKCEDDIQEALRVMKGILARIRR